jgi:hypothetical protein
MLSKIFSLFLLAVILIGCSQPRIDAASLTPQVYIPFVIKNNPTRIGYAGYPPATLPELPNYAWRIGTNNLAPNIHRMIWCCDQEMLDDLENAIIDAAQTDFNNGVKNRVWLYLNEPDLQGQCGGKHINGTQTDYNNNSPIVSTVPEIAAQRFVQLHALITSYDPHAQFYVGGLALLNSPDWWLRFIGELHALNASELIDGIHIHGYPRWTTGTNCQNKWCMPELFAALENWYQFGITDLNLDHLPVWITETGSAAYCNDYTYNDPQSYIDSRDNIMLPLLEWFNSSSNPGYNRIYWFLPLSPSPPEQQIWWCSFLTNLDGTLTPLGEAWKIP